MSTIGYDSWAVDLAEVGAVYPFQGGEVLLVVIGVAVWVACHFMQFCGENGDYAEMKKEYERHGEDTAAADSS